MDSNSSRFISLLFSFDLTYRHSLIKVISSFFEGFVKCLVVLIIQINSNPGKSSKNETNFPLFFGRVRESGVMK